MSMDAANNRALYGQPRISDRWSIATAGTADELASALDAHLPRDPRNPGTQLVRSSYLAPVDRGAPRPTFLRIREYLGAIDGSNTSSAAFLELKHVAADGTKHKERVPVALDAVEYLRRSPTGTTLRAVAAAHGDDPVVLRAVELIDGLPHRLEPGTEYGRRAWEDAASTIRVTIDDVAAAGASLLHDGAVRRVLEVKHRGSGIPAFLATALDDAARAGTILRIGAAARAVR